MNPQSLDLPQLRTSMARANHHFSLMREKHPTLKVYLVLSLPGVQTKADSSLDGMLKEMPDLLSNGDVKNRMTKFLCGRQDASNLEDTAIWKARFEDLTLPLEFKASVQAGLLFQYLDHPLIWKLQSVELIARHITPQTKTSIRIVLGAICHFYKTTKTQNHPFPRSIVARKSMIAGRRTDRGYPVSLR